MRGTYAANLRRQFHGLEQRNWRTLGHELRFSQQRVHPLRCRRVVNPYFAPAFAEFLHRVTETVVAMNLNVLAEVFADCWRHLSQIDVEMSGLFLDDCVRNEDGIVFHVPPTQIEQPRDRVQLVEHMCRRAVSFHFSAYALQF